jgi:hypothetical protein
VSPLVEAASIESSGTPSPHHVLERPWTYAVVGLTVDFDGGQNEVLLELRLRKGSDLVTLVFFGVHELEIDAGFPWLGSGMQILDESSRGMEDAKIRVSSFEQDPAIRFWARGVKRVSAD